jgi:stress response protein YsnF
MSSNNTDTDTNDNRTTTIPLIEESVRIDKRLVDGDSVKVSTKTTEHTEWVRETLVGETINISRVPIGKDVSAIPAVREEDGVTIVPVVEERLVVTKQLHLLEEIHISKKQTDTPFSEPVTLRRMQASVDRTSPEQTKD